MAAGKIGPVGAYLAVAGLDVRETVEDIARIATMTHRTSLAISSGLAHAAAARHVLLNHASTFSPSGFVSAVVEASRMGREYRPDTLTQDDLTDRLARLPEAMDWSEDRIIEEFCGGTYYAFNSLPFTYAFFLQNPNHIESLYRVVRFRRRRHRQQRLDARRAARGTPR